MAYFASIRSLAAHPSSPAPLQARPGVILSSLKSSIACSTSTGVSVPSQVATGLRRRFRRGLKGALWVTRRTGEIRDMSPLMVHEGCETVSYQLLPGGLDRELQWRSQGLHRRHSHTPTADDGHSLHRGRTANNPRDVPGVRHALLGRALRGRLTALTATALPCGSRRGARYGCTSVRWLRLPACDASFSLWSEAVADRLSILVPRPGAVSGRESSPVRH